MKTLGYIYGVVGEIQLTDSQGIHLREDLTLLDRSVLKNVVDQLNERLRLGGSLISSDGRACHVSSPPTLSDLDAVSESILLRSRGVLRASHCCNSSLDLSPERR